MVAICLFIASTSDIAMRTTSHVANTHHPASCLSTTLPTTKPQESLLGVAVTGTDLTGKWKISLSDSDFGLLFVSEIVNFGELYRRAIFK
ncbi:MAG: hypothetical protein ACK4FZ_05455 [Vogesella sp.]|uniref:hypothetical protein n=1 Tax=Vogesella sp. TaxID=1904252 RepID=UPI00391A0E2E